MNTETYSRSSQLLHWGLALFGIIAWLTGENADDGFNSNGFLLHLYLGLAVLTFILLRFGAGILSNGKLSFRGWTIFTREQWRLAAQDIGQLVRFKLPHRKMHQGIAGLVQFSGLLLFLWMAASGTLIFLLQNSSESTLFEAIEEGHEVGEVLIPLFLILHVGAVIVHTLAGDHVWKSMVKKDHP
ncbi:cytochrome b/b6 domain-containing protein [Kangiella koreensis]|uniref:Cytochrome B561 n=1 Tax=Kangiella koreensis (strain DSM 16069 / JCM 12317 / KCTC 12182 / SW-125) TaxID=523791 RepID=C7R789_KANKD|nr:cytochrome b/b6 domain-containing protein [Kangiella koreensis]ACV27545.1 cytochrome B561 [Kangiella koreensis DSM 16069]